MPILTYLGKYLHSMSFSEIQNLSSQSITFRTLIGGQSKRLSTNETSLLALLAMAGLYLMTVSCNLQWHAC